MPTVARIGSLRVMIYPNDHRPAHVHVIGGELTVLCEEWSGIHESEQGRI